jgi:hypothetical protein
MKSLFNCKPKVGLDWSESLIYCDAAPNFGSGGFGAVLGAIFNDELPLIRNKLITSVNSDCAGFYNHTYLGLLGGKFLKYPWVIRFLLFIVDFFVIYFWRKIPASLYNKNFCVWVGSDWSAIFRGLLIARKIRSRKIAVYIVDDIFNEAQPVNSLIKMVRYYFICFLLKRFDLHFVITNNLAISFSGRVDVEWRTMHLPYRLDEFVKHRLLDQNIVERTNFSCAERSTTLVFIGGLQQAVIDILLDICHIIANVNNKQGRVAYCLHVVSNDIRPIYIKNFEIFISLGVLRVSCNLSDDDISRSFDDHSIFLCPYPSGNKFRNLVETSFPSKLLKMVLFGRPILLVAPSFSAVRLSHGKFFHEVDIQHLEDVLVDSASLFSKDFPCFNQDFLDLHSLRKYLETLEVV